MKLVNTLYDLEFDLIENQILVLSIENHLVYSNILETLWKQYKGENGDFILSDESKELKLSQKRDLEYSAKQYGCSFHELHDPKLKYPEEIEW